MWKARREADDFVARPHVVELCPLGALGDQQTFYPVKGNAAVVADNAASAVSIR